MLLDVIFVYGAMDEDNSLPSTSFFSGQPAVTVDAFGKVRLVSQKSYRYRYLAGCGYGVTSVGNGHVRVALASAD